MYYRNSKMERNCVNQLIDIRDEEENDFNPIEDKIRMTNFLDLHQLLISQQQQPDKILNQNDTRGETMEETPSVKGNENLPVPETQKSFVFIPQKQAAKANVTFIEKQEEETHVNLHKQTFTRKFLTVNQQPTTPLNKAYSPKVKVNTFQIISNYFSQRLLREELNKSLIKNKNILTINKVHKINESILKNAIYNKKIQIVQKPALQILTCPPSRNNFKSLQNFIDIKQRLIIKDQDNMVNRILVKKYSENKKKQSNQQQNIQANILNQQLNIKQNVNRSSQYKRQYSQEQKHSEYY